jgi:hypothetical protein
MTLISKLAISLFISVTSIFVLHKPPAPTPAETKPAPITVWQGLEPASPLPTTTVVTTPITQPDACQTVFDMARHVGWPEHELSMVVSVAYRESRCQPDAFNAKDPNGGSARCNANQLLLVQTVTLLRQRIFAGIRPYTHMRRPI